MLRIVDGMFPSFSPDGKRNYEGQTKPAAMTIQVKSAECRDLGRLKLRLAPENTGERPGDP